jgi:predicted lipid-binding transport protein (Tim44 family)
MKDILKIFHIFSESYGEFVQGSKLGAKISEVYSFANNIFMKVLFTGKQTTDKMDSFKEEWTFSRSLIFKEVNWFLTNVDRLDE